MVASARFARVPCKSRRKDPQNATPLPFADQTKRHRRACTTWWLFHFPFASIETFAVSGALPWYEGKLRVRGCRSRGRCGDAAHLAVF